VTTTLAPPHDPDPCRACSVSLLSCTTSATNAAGKPCCDRCTHQIEESPWLT
jgi:hypothetical protein